jgi:glycosidase
VRRCLLRQWPSERDVIIVGAYPDLIEAADGGGTLDCLRRALEAILPLDVVVHILPPYPASGDYGFAPDDWYSVRSELGDWSDIVHWASKRKLILDGIYNHVGRQHPFVLDFFSNPTEDGALYTYLRNTPPSEQLSPRGGSVFRSYELGNRIWQVWQTFSKTSFDIRMSHPRVRDEIGRHHAFLAQSGIFGVRLDGCAYYGHDLNVEQFHNPNGKVATQGLARAAQDAGLFVLAQLDSDPEGASYFLRDEGWSVPVVDYSYSAVLVRALLTESAPALALHIQRTAALPCRVIRPPRTHDGILLQSDLLTQEELDDLEALAGRWNLPVRSANGESYELNSSMPYICSLGVDDDDAWRRIIQVVMLTGFLSGTPYFYLPFIIGDVPERRKATPGDDPRSLNRTHLELAQLTRFSQGPRCLQLVSALRVIGLVQQNFSEDAIDAAEATNSVLTVSRSHGRCIFVCNLSTTETAKLRLPRSATLIHSNNLDDATLGPLGFGVWSDAKD